MRMDTRLTSGTPRMPQNFQASSGRLAVTPNFTQEAAVLNPMNARVDLPKFGRHPAVTSDDVVPRQSSHIQLQLQVIFSNRAP